MLIDALTRGYCHQINSELQRGLLTVIGEKCYQLLDDIASCVLVFECNIRLLKQTEDETVNNKPVAALK